MNILSNGLMRHRRGTVALFCMCLIYFFAYFQRLALPGTIFDELQSEFHASAAAITALGAIFLYVYGFMQFFTGLLADRFGGARVLLTGGAVLAVSSIVFPLVHSLPWLYLMRALTGLGASLVFISIVKELDTMVAARHFAMMLCVVLFVGYAGGVAGTMPLAHAVAIWGWRLAMLVCGVLCGAVWLATWFFLRGRQPPAAIPSGQHGLWRRLRIIIVNPDTRPIITFGAINFGVYFLWQATLGKKLLTDIAGYTSDQASMVTFWMMLISMLSTSCSGFVSRLVGNRRCPPIIFCAVLTALSMAGMSVALIAGGRGGWLYVGLLAVALASSASPVVCAVIKEVNPPESAGSSVGFLNGVSYLAVAVIGNLAGVVMDVFGGTPHAAGGAVVYPRTAYLCLMLACLALALWSLRMAWRVRESRGVSVYGVPG